MSSAVVTGELRISRSTGLTVHSTRVPPEWSALAAAQEPDMLASLRSAGDPVLEACLAGTHPGACMSVVDEESAICTSFVTEAAGGSIDLRFWTFATVETHHLARSNCARTYLGAGKACF